MRLLRLMRMLGPGVHLELRDHLVSQLILGQHAPHGFFNDQFRLALQSRFGRDGSLARVPGVPTVFFLLPLFAGHLHFLGIDDDDDAYIDAVIPDRRAQQGPKTAVDQEVEILERQIDGFGLSFKILNGHRPQPEAIDGALGELTRAPEP